MHYKRLLKTGHPLGTRQLPKGTYLACTVEGCGGKHMAKGLCQKHYSRLRNTGDPLKVRKLPNGTYTVCKVEGCERKHKSLGFCATHLVRFVKHGDPGTKFRAGRKGGYGKGWVNRKGYREVYSPGRRTVREHRQVMEKKLGRKLLPSEDVHHINGNRADNREENLMVIDHIEHQELHRKQRSSSLRSEVTDGEASQRTSKVLR